MSPDRSRLVTFEVAQTIYGVPIADVIEVAEVTAPACVPTLPPSRVGVVNHHGDALPVVSRGLAFQADESALAAPQHLLVLGERDGDGARVGLPVDRVLGLVDAGSDMAAPSQGLVVERRPVGGRLVHVLSTSRLLARVAESVEQSIEAWGRASARPGGETS